MVNITQQLELKILHAEQWTPDFCGRKDRGIPYFEPVVETLSKNCYLTMKLHDS